MIEVPTNVEFEQLKQKVLFLETTVQSMNQIPANVKAALGNIVENLAVIMEWLTNGDGTD